MTSPRHTHDCDDCIFLGEVGPSDVYVCCGDDGADTLIERSGDEGPAYSSLPAQLYRQTCDLSDHRKVVYGLFQAFLAGRNSL